MTTHKAKTIGRADFWKSRPRNIHQFNTPVLRAAYLDGYNGVIQHGFASCNERCTCGAR